MKNHQKIFVISFSALFSILSIPIKANSVPYSFENKLTASVQTLELRSFNNDSILKVNSQCSLCGGKFGFGIPEDIDMKNSGNWEDMPNGNKVWRLRIKSATAVGLRVNWDNFILPMGGTLFVTDGDRQIVGGPFTSLNNKKNKIFTTGNIYKKQLMLEYDQPALVHEIPEFHILEVVYIYKNMQTLAACGISTSGPVAGSDFGCAASCLNNVNCSPWVTGHCTDIRATVRYDFEEQNGDGATDWASCSGVLVNNTANDFTPYILTARHCVSASSQFPKTPVHPELWIVYFNWQSPDCINEWGNIKSVIVGVTVLASAGNMACNDEIDWDPDMALMVASEKPPIQYNVYYAGWDRFYTASELPTTDVTIIGHPESDIKKVYDGTVNNIWATDACNADILNWWQITPTNGFSQPGSSGCPIFCNHDVIGTFSLINGSGSTSTCDGTVYNENAGRLGDFWSSISGYLDPLDLGTWILDGIDPISPCQSDITITRDHWPAQSWQQEPLITIQASHTITAQGGSPSDPDAGATYIKDYTTPSGVTYYSQYVYSAGDAIDLKPGFGVDPGNSFKGVISSSCQTWTTSCGFNYVSSPVPTGNKNQNNNLFGSSPNITSPGQNEGLSIDPNPFSDVVNVNFNLVNPESITISIIDVNGNYMKNLPAKNYGVGNNSEQIPMRDLSSGVYYLKFFDGQTIQVKQIIKL